MVSESGCHLHNRQVLSLLPVCVESEEGVCVKKRRLAWESVHIIETDL